MALGSRDGWLSPRIHTRRFPALRLERFRVAFVTLCDEFGRPPVVFAANSIANDYEIEAAIFQRHRTREPTAGGLAQD